MKTKIPTDEWIKKNSNQLKKADLFMRKIKKEYDTLDTLTIEYINFLTQFILVQRKEKEKTK